MGIRELSWLPIQLLLICCLSELVLAEGFDEQPPAPPPLPPPNNAKPLFKEPGLTAWVDSEEGTIIIDGQVSLREGPLEMFACTRNTKEHESIVVCDTLAFPIHAALLAVGAEPGAPVRFEPEFSPPTGDEIEIEVRWREPTTKKWISAKARDWIRNVKTKQAMEYPWVFAGSILWTDPDSGQQYYEAERGDFICVSNFSSAMLDVPIESSAINDGLFFEALTENIPPEGTRVRLVLKPQLKEIQTAEELERSGN